MFKLYTNGGIRKMIDVSENKQDIIDTMGEYIKDDPEARFMVKTQSKENGDSVKCINGFMDYALYVEEYNASLKQMSCTELKREIVKRKKL